MKFFNRKWEWRYEIAPMYMHLVAKPLTSKEQIFKLICGVESDEIFKGERLPQIGEYVDIPYFKKQFRVRDIRSISLGGNKMSKGMFPVTVNLDPNDFGDSEYWQVRETPHKEQMRTLDGWHWGTGFHPSNYERFGHTPSDWLDSKLKIKERDFVLQWEKSGLYFMTPKGDEILDLDAKHNYLYDWFPEVREHLHNLKWQK